MKCEIPECTNEDWQGEFDGKLCKPCRNELIKIIDMPSMHSQAFRNLKKIATKYIRQSEYFKIDQNWK